MRREGANPKIFSAMGQWPRMAAWVMHWYSAVSSAALCLQENLTALYLLCTCTKNHREKNQGHLWDIYGRVHKVTAQEKDL